MMRNWIVDSFSAKFVLPRLLNGRLVMVRFACWFSCLLFLFGLVGGAAGATDVHDAVAALAQPGLLFAIADFDGDSHPDLANVWAGHSDLKSTEYWIQLQLSAGSQQSIRVVAPVGGLRIAARDVNGDESPDLVVMTALLNHPVAVYLNNGHGSFIHAEPAAFPKAFSESRTSWIFIPYRMPDASGELSQLRYACWPEMRWLSYLQSQVDFIMIHDLESLCSPLLNSHPGRAPPSGALPI